MARRRGKMMAAPIANNPPVPRPPRALWYARKGVVELREADLAPPGPGEARVRTRFSGISRGTERLVLEGRVGRGEWERMRCPMQEGAFPFPVKYGYCAAGIVEEGPADVMRKHVFCLHPHQEAFNAPVSQLAVIPDEIPLRRATLTANMETALNALWDSGAGPGDRIVVVGAGVVGLLVASLCARLPGTGVTAVTAQCEIAATQTAGHPVSCTLQVSDGRPAVLDAVNCDQPLSQPVALTALGSYTLTLVVRDDVGGKVEATQTVSVTAPPNRAPVVSAFTSNVTSGVVPANAPRSSLTRANSGAVRSRRGPVGSLLMFCCTMSVSRTSLSSCSMS